MYDSGVAVIVEAAHQAATVDVSPRDERSLMADAVGLAEAISALEAALAHTAAELDHRGTCERETGLSTGSWLAHETHLPKGRARRPVAVGRGLRALPLIDEAVADGRLTVEHGAYVARRCTPRVVDALVLVQDQIIDWAADCSFEIWSHQVAALVELLDDDGAHDPERDDPCSELTVADSLDGVTHLAGRFAGADAALVRQAIEAKADELFHRAKRDRDETDDDVEVPPRQVLRAQALAEICRLANARDIGSSNAPRPDITLIVRAQEPTDEQPDDPAGEHASDQPDEPGDDRPDEPTGDRLDERADDARVGDGPDDEPGDEPAGNDGCDPTGDDPGERAGHRPDERADTTTRPPVPVLDPLWPPVAEPTGVRLQDATTRALLCDPDLHALIVDRLGVPLDLGRTVRYATDDQRRALATRDGGCIFPGCDRPPGWTDAHHVHHWERAGPTDLANLALLCRRHHGITHRHGWTMHATTDGWYWWTAPNGHTFWSQRHGHQRAGPTPT